MNFTRIFSYFFTRMFTTNIRIQCIRMLVVCIRMFRMLLVCYSYVLVWCFSHDLVPDGKIWNGSCNLQLPRMLFLIR